MIYDVKWYGRSIGDPETREPRRFRGGELAAYDRELDALFHGVDYENNRRKREYALRSVFTLIQLLGGQDMSAPRLQLLDTTAWLEAVNVLDEPHHLPAHLDPSTAIAFRLDVLRAMAYLPPSYRAAVVHKMDGYSLWEIADLMGWMREVRDAFGVSLRDSNVESAERIVRKASSEIRGRLHLDIPGKKHVPEPPKHPTSVVNEVEKSIEATRTWRSSKRRNRNG